MSESAPIKSFTMSYKNKRQILLHSEEHSILANGKSPWQHQTPINFPQSTNLSWRLDPVESLSDWTIVVVSNEHAGDEQMPPKNANCDSASVVSDLSEKNDDSREKRSTKRHTNTASKRYYVHRAVLGVGPRKGDFFTDLFHKHRLATENEKDDRDPITKDLDPVTHIEVKPSAAAAFGLMLDFMYAPNDTPVKATTESAVALRHLSIALGIRELFNSVTPFIQKDLSANTSPVYLFESFRYNHEKLFNVALKTCASNFEDIKLSSIIILPPHLLGKVLDSPHFQCDSEALSSRIASYFRCRPKAANKENLFKFTSSEIMPKIATHEVLFYLNLMEESGLILKNDRRNISLKNSSLYERCLAGSSEAIYSFMEDKLFPEISVKHTKERQKKAAEVEFETISSRVKVDLLEKALLEKMRPSNTHVTASHRLQNDRQTSIFVKKRTPSKREKGSISRSSRDSRYLGQRREHRDDSSEQQIRSLQEKIKAQEQTIKKYATELSKFSRVPNQYLPPPMLSDYTYKKEPVYDSYGESIYGYIPPTAFPRMMHNKVVDGWVYREQDTDNEINQGSIWPMYYYKGY